MNDATSEEQSASPANNSRRHFCLAAISGMAAVTVGTVGYPIVSFLRLPKSLRQEESMEVALSDLPEDSAMWGEHMGRQVVVIKTGGEVRAFDGACTHLGCIVQWDGASHTFRCPCHGAAFDDNGKPVSGPVNIPLRRIEFVVREGVLKIT